MKKSTLIQFIILSFVVLASIQGSAKAASDTARSGDMWLPRYDGNHCYVAPAVTKSAAPVDEQELCKEIKMHEGKLDAYVVITKAGTTPLDGRSPARVPLATVLSNWKAEGRFRFDGNQILVLAIQSKRADHPNLYAFDASTGDELSKLGITQQYLDQHGIFRLALTSNKVDVSSRIATLVERIADISEQASRERDAGANNFREVLAIILVGSGATFACFRHVSHKRIHSILSRFTNQVNRYNEISAGSLYNESDERKLTAVQPYWDTLNDLVDQATTQEKRNVLSGPIAGWLLLKKGATVNGRHLDISELTTEVENLLK